jgi:hypothetical protein
MKPEENTLILWEKVKDLIIEPDPIHVGSSSIVDDESFIPNDVDWLFTMKDHTRFPELCHRLETYGWEAGGSDIFKTRFIENKFYSFTSTGKDNLIISMEKEFTRRFCLANDVCKKLNLKLREQRVMVHRAFLYEESPYDHEKDPFAIHDF